MNATCSATTGESLTLAAGSCVSAERYIKTQLAYHAWKVFTWDKIYSTALIHINKATARIINIITDKDMSKSHHICCSNIYNISDRPEITYHLLYTICFLLVDKEPLSLSFFKGSGWRFPGLECSYDPSERGRRGRWWRRRRLRHVSQQQ